MRYIILYISMFLKYKVKLFIGNIDLYIISMISKLSIVLFYIYAISKIIYIFVIT